MNINHNKYYEKEWQNLEKLKTGKAIVIYQTKTD
jgi:hypothetical protein